jgi:prepilin-type N-terminal cleavage/methylation domain-containing protein
MTRSSRKRPPRRGFSLAELLVVLCIGVIVAGLLVMGVVKYREAADRLASANNLKQIALATIDMAGDNHGKLPRPGDASYPTEWDGKPGDIPPKRTGYGPPLFHIIPYVEADSLYADSYSEREGIYWARKLRGTRYRLYQAPGDPTVDPSSDSCSYAVNELAFAPTPKGFRRLPADFPDSPSNTILYAEQYAHQHGTWGTGWTEPRLFRSYTEKDGVRTPKDPPFQLRPVPGRDDFDGERPQGFFRSGVQVVMADGRTVLVRAQVSAQTFYAASTPDDGDILTPDW